MFEIKGKIQGKEYFLRYENGILKGDEIAKKKAFEENKNDYGYLGLFPSRSSQKEGYLKNELSAYHLIEKFVFDEIIESKDDWNFSDDEIY